MVEPHLTRRQREDPLVIAWLRVQAWMEANARLLAILAVAAVVVVAAGVLWSRARAQAEGKAGARIAEISSFYWRGLYDRVLEQAAEVRRDYRGTRAATDALRLQGDAHFWLGDFKKAAEAYETYLKENRKPSVIRSGVRRNLAQAYESDTQFKPAAEIYEELAREPGPRLARADLLYAAGRARQATGDTARATALYEQVSREYSDTPSAPLADLGLGELRLRSP